MMWLRWELSDDDDALDLFVIEEVAEKLMSDIRLIHERLISIWL